MKLNNSMRGFDAVLSDVLKEDYQGNITGIASGKPRKDKYFPPTIEQVPSIRFNNQDVPMGQDEIETDAPSNMLYPFDSIFSELVGQYVKCTEMLGMLRSAAKLPTLTDQKKNIVHEAIKQLTKIANELKSTVEKIEQLSI
jgi:hypothetical protein